MQAGLTSLERAFDLARFGLVSDLDHLKRKLHRDGFESDILRGAALRKQLCDVIRKARKDSLWPDGDPRLPPLTTTRLPL